MKVWVCCIYIFLVVQEEVGEVFGITRQDVGYIAKNVNNHIIGIQQQYAKNVKRG